MFEALRVGCILRVPNKQVAGVELNLYFLKTLSRSDNISLMIKDYG